MTVRALGVLLLLPVLGAAQEPRAAAYVPDLATSEMRDVVSRFSQDQRDLLRRYDDEYSPERRRVLRDFYGAWVSRLNTIDFDKLGEDARVDWILLRADVVHEQALLDREEKRLAEVSGLVPFADTIFALEDARRRLEFEDPAAAGRTLAWLAAKVSSASLAVSPGLRPGSGKADSASRPSRIEAYHAWQIVRTLKNTLASWYKFYDGYDPLFTWWAKEPYAKADSALDVYAKTLRQDLVGWKPGDDEPIVGLPIGRDGLMADLMTRLPYVRRPGGTGVRGI